MKKRIAIAITLIAATGALAAAPFLLADDRSGGFHGHGFRHGFGPLARIAHVKEELDLSDQQVDQIKAIVAETRQQTAPYRKQLHGGYRGVLESLLENPNDIAAAQALVDQQVNAERAMKTSVLNAASKALAVLNDEQRAKLTTMLEEHEARHHARHGR